MVKYQLDGYANITHAQGSQTFFGRGSTGGGCLDSASNNFAYNGAGLFPYTKAAEACRSGGRGHGKTPAAGSSASPVQC